LTTSLFTVKVAIKPIHNSIIINIQATHMCTIAVSNQKGGVGKTSLCLHMAGAMAQRKHKVLLIDMDQ